MTNLKATYNNRFKFLRLVLACGLLLAVGSIKAQLNFEFLEGKFLIKGQVVDIASGQPVGFANIALNSGGKGITCDNEGRFTLYVYLKDTLKFSSVGYLAKTVYAYNIDSGEMYTLQVKMAPDVIKLKTAEIYYWGDRGKFNDAFIAAKDMNKVVIPGIAPPKYSNTPPKAKFTNPISFLYERVKKRRAADPDFKP
ncbi:MAG: carboxypeptidase-like regulatory domain-containing protein [Chitinophagales bacterium]